MGSDERDPSPSLAYRLPSTEPSASLDAEPTSWRAPSAKVLDALARLSRAKGVDETSTAFALRAERRREAERTRIVPSWLPGGHRARRCSEGHAAYRAGDFDAALSLYRQWLLEAEHLEHESGDRVEVLVMLAVLSRWERRRDEAEALLRHAVALRQALSSDVPLEGALALAGTLRSLEQHDDARGILDRVEARSEPEIAALLRARADDALATGNAPRALALATDALSRWNTLIAPEHREHAATRLTVARAHVAERRWATADRQLCLVLDTLEAGDDRGLEARALSVAAEVLYAQGHREQVVGALSRSLDLTWRSVHGPFAVHLPVLSIRHRLLTHLGELADARTTEDSIERIYQRYRTCLTAEAR